MTSCREKKDYVSLRSIRGIGAILIFYHHFGFDNPVTASFGDFAVSLFFMLSGLVLSMSYSGSPSDRHFPKIRSFMKKRILKIYPVYFISLAAAILVKGCYLPALPLDLLLLQSWIPETRFYFSGNSVSWFVSTLFFAYLLFLPLHKALSKRPGLFLRLFGLGLVIYFFIAAAVPEPHVKGIVYINPVMELPTFVIGMLIWHVFGCRDTKVRMSCKKALLIQVASIILAVTFIYVFRYVNPRYSLSSFWWLPNFILLAVALTTEDQSSPINKLLRLKVFRLIGDISLTFYLFHTIIITIYLRFLNKAAIHIDSLPSSLICLLITLAVSFLLHRYVEIPLSRMLNRQTKNRI